MSDPTKDKMEKAFTTAQNELSKFMESANAQIPVQLIQPILVQYVDLVQDNSRLRMDLSSLQTANKQLSDDFDKSNLKSIYVIYAYNYLCRMRRARRDEGVQAAD